jgi:DNA-binding transcriptional LysR family regulator
MLHLLETFCAVADSGSLNKATEVLHLTQPAITRQIQALEAQLGAVLLRRTPRGVALTPVGEAILPHARAALAAVRMCQRLAAEASAGAAQHLRIAAGLMVTLYVLPPVLARFRERYPGVRIDLRPGHRRDAVDALLAYEVDAAIIASDVALPQLKAFPILSDPLLLISPPEGVPADAADSGGRDGAPRMARLGDLVGTPLLVLPQGTGLAEQIEAALAAHGVTCDLVRSPTAETIKMSVGFGMGSTILPVSAVRQELRAGTLAGREIADWPEARRVVRLLVRAEGRTPDAVQTLLGLLQGEYA